MVSTDKEDISIADSSIVITQAIWTLSPILQQKDKINLLLAYFLGFPALCQNAEHKKKKRYCQPSKSP